jgi:hypothetical protein
MMGKTVFSTLHTKLKAEQRILKQHGMKNLVV